MGQSVIGDDSIGQSVEDDDDDDSIGQSVEGDDDDSIG